MLREPLTNAKTSSPTKAVLACAMKIADQIRLGKIMPLQKLSEGPLSEQLGIGRARIRAALDHLAYSGIVERRAQSGTYVRCLSLADLVECSAFRGLLEGFAARDATKQMPRTELKELEKDAVKLDTQIVTHSVSWPRLRDMDVAFHLRISEHCVSANIRDMLQNQHFITRYLSAHRQLNLPTVYQRAEGKRYPSIPTHRDIVQALRERDADRAERVVRDHVWRSIQMTVVEYAELNKTDATVVADAKAQLERLDGWLGKPAAVSATGPRSP